MKIIRNRYIPFGRYAAINLFGVIFSKYELSATSRNHEFIHTLQQRELLFLFFYIVYILEFLVKLIIYRNSHIAYLNISFEREAYHNQYNLNYRHERRFWAWTKYLRKKKTK